MDKVKILLSSGDIKPLSYIAALAGVGAEGIHAWPAEYSDDMIVLSVGRDKLTVRGSCLELADFRDCVLYVRGNIDSASFVGGGA